MNTEDFLFSLFGFEILYLTFNRFDTDCTSKLERALGRAHTFAAATFLVPFHDLDHDQITRTKKIHSDQNITFRILECEGN